MVYAHPVPLAGPSPLQRAARRMAVSALGDSVAEGLIQAFSEGEKAGIVGRILTPTGQPAGAVVKLGPDRELLEEALRVMYDRRDPQLPAAWRAAVPEVRAGPRTIKQTEGTFYGYAMEDLSLSHMTLRKLLARPGGLDHAESVFEAFWDILERGYASTLNPWLSPSFDERVRQTAERVEQATTVRPELDRELRLLRGERVSELPRWPGVLMATSQLGGTAGPAWASVVHGDPSLDNFLVPRTGDPSRDLKLIDPRPYGQGDTAWDVAALLVSIWEWPLEQDTNLGWSSRFTANASGTTVLCYEPPVVPAPLARAADALRGLSENLAAHIQDPGWRLRVQLSFGLRLLALGSLRLAAGERRALGLVAFGEGLDLLWTAVRRHSVT